MRSLSSRCLDDWRRRTDASPLKKLSVKKVDCLYFSGHCSHNFLHMSCTIQASGARVTYYGHISSLSLPSDLINAIIHRDTPIQYAIASAMAAIAPFAAAIPGLIAESLVCMCPNGHHVIENFQVQRHIV
jgi:hypothetical protein